MNNTLHWLIAYDIHDKKRLYHAEKIINCYGWQLQKSLYESQAEEKDIRHMKALLERTIEKEDFILVFRICEKDFQKREIYGKLGAADPMNKPFLIL